jgi:hypothetical protein
MSPLQSASAPQSRKTTRQLLEKIPNFPCLYRHSLSKTYYGICKVRGNRKEHSLKTSDRKIAERRLKDWMTSLKETNTELEKLTLAELLPRRQGQIRKDPSHKRVNHQLFQKHLAVRLGHPGRRGQAVTAKRMARDP